MDIITRLEEAELLAGVEDGTADLVAATGHVDDGQGDNGGGRRRLEVVTGRQNEAVRVRLVALGHEEHVVGHGRRIYSGKR